MKKDPNDYTTGERKFADLVAAFKAGKPNAYTYRVNSAVTKDGDFVIGLTYHSERQYYSASAIEIDGVRDNSKLCSCLLYTSPSPRDRTRSRMPSSA